jgi:hypothetical protein
LIKKEATLLPSKTVITCMYSAGSSFDSNSSHSNSHSGFKFKSHSFKNCPSHQLLITLSTWALLKLICGINADCAGENDNQSHKAKAQIVVFNRI